MFVSGAYNTVFCVYIRPLFSAECHVRQMRQFYNQLYTFWLALKKKPITNLYYEYSMINLLLRAVQLFRKTNIILISFRLISQIATNFFFVSDSSLDFILNVSCMYVSYIYILAVVYGIQIGFTLCSKVDLSFL